MRYEIFWAESLLKALQNFPATNLQDKFQAELYSPQNFQWVGKNCI